MIRSHLEYAAPVWSPHSWKCATELEKVQKRATKRIPGFENIPYEERLKRLKLPTLVYRRIRGDMINVFKYLSGHFKTKPLFTVSQDNYDTRGHNKKLQVLGAHTDRHKHTFVNRIVSWWNNLPTEVVNAPSINSFKNRFDRHFINHPMVYNYRALDCPTAPFMTVS